MLLYYIRHGDPTYRPNMLTPLGKRQAEAVARRLSMHGIDKIYSSPSTRAVETATPTAEILKKEIELVDFTDETHAWAEMTCEREDGKLTWMFCTKENRALLSSPEVRELGHKWYTHPAFTQYEEGIRRVYDEGDAFLKSLGYEHVRYTGSYKYDSPSDERIALFAHAGFGSIFLSCLLDIPYPSFAMQFDMTHTGMTVIEFTDEGGISYPRVLTYSSDAHLYKENLPTLHSNRIYI